MKFIHLSGLISVFWIPTLFGAEISCPGTIAVKEIVINQKDWKNTDLTSAKTFKGATLFVGQLGDTSSSLAPEQQKKNGEVIQTWDLKPYHAKRETIWMECQYFDTGIKLSQVIPVTINTCEGSFKVDKFNNPQGGYPFLCK